MPRRKLQQASRSTKRVKIEDEVSEENSEKSEQEEKDEEGSKEGEADLVALLPERRGSVSVLPVRRASGETPFVMTIKAALAMTTKPKHACVRIGVMPKEPRLPMVRSVCGFCTSIVQDQQFWESPGPDQERKIKCKGKWSSRDNKFSDQHVNTPTTVKSHPMQRTFVLQGIVAIKCYVDLTLKEVVSCMYRSDNQRCDRRECLCCQCKREVGPQDVRRQGRFCAR